MLVNEIVELQSSKTVTIDTSEYRLSSEPCGHTLNSRERSGSVYDKKPTYYLFESKSNEAIHPWFSFFMHYSCSGRCTLC